jgi:glutaredoxin
MKLVLYLKEGCPYCQMIKEELADKDMEVEMYYAGKDFTPEDYKKKYGNDATYPRAFVVDGKNNHLLKDSEAIMEFLNNEFGNNMEKGDMEEEQEMEEGDTEEEQEMEEGDMEDDDQ